MICQMDELHYIMIKLSPDILNILMLMPLIHITSMMFLKLSGPAASDMKNLSEQHTDIGAAAHGVLFRWKSLNKSI